MGIFCIKCLTPSMEKVTEIIDKKIYSNFVNIIYKMESNIVYRQFCLSQAEESVKTCDDRATLGFVYFVLPQKGYPDNTPNTQRTLRL